MNEKNILYSTGYVKKNFGPYDAGVRLFLRLNLKKPRGGTIGKCLFTRFFTLIVAKAPTSSKTL